MADYDVMVQNVEENDEYLSVTGLVNRVQVAAVVKKNRIQGHGRAAVLDNALVDAFLAQPPREPSAAAHRITRS